MPKTFFIYLILSILAGFLILPACGDTTFTDVPEQTTKENEQGVLTTQINASDKESFVYFDLDHANQEHTNHEGWDIAFKRQFIKVHGEAGVKVATVVGKKLDAVISHQGLSFYTDSGGEEADQAFSKEDLWYDYNFLMHKLSPKARTYVIRSSEGAHFKMQLTTYYDDQNRGGFPTFSWKKLEPTK